MNQDKKLSIKNIQTNFLGLKVKSKSKYKDALLQDKALMSERRNIQTSNNQPVNRALSVNQDQDKSESTKSYANTSGRFSTDIPKEQVNLTSTFSNFGPKKVFQQSSVQEIHNNVYNFFPGPNIDTFMVKKNTLAHNSIVTQNNEYEKSSNITNVLNEKNEYIKFLLSENNALKLKIQEKSNENKQLRSKIESIGISSSPNINMKTDVDSLISKDKLNNTQKVLEVKSSAIIKHHPLSPSSNKNECKL